MSLYTRALDTSGAAKILTEKQVNKEELPIWEKLPYSNTELSCLDVLDVLLG